MSIIDNLLSENNNWKEMSVPDQIDSVTNEIATLLKEKNKAYGNSALNPIRVFSKANSTEQLLVRIDDKLSRIQRGKDLDKTDESRIDTITDLLGYLPLLIIDLVTQEAQKQDDEIQRSILNLGADRPDDLLDSLQYAIDPANCGVGLTVGEGVVGLTVGDPIPKGHVHFTTEQINEKHLIPTSPTLRKFFEYDRAELKKYVLDNNLEIFLTTYMSNDDVRDQIISKLKKELEKTETTNIENTDSISED